MRLLGRRLHFSMADYLAMPLESFIGLIEQEMEDAKRERRKPKS